MSTTPTQVIIGIFALSLTFLFINLFILRHRQARRRWKQVQDAASRKWPREEQSIEEWELQVGAEVDRRAEQKASTTSGDQIWYSRYIHGGYLKHVVILAQGMRYEIRRDNSNDDFNYLCGPWSFEQEEERANLAEISLAKADSYHMCLIGWTKKSQGDIWSQFELQQREFGRSVLPKAKYHKFLQAFVSRILSKEAVDQVWFDQSVRLPYSGGDSLPPPPPALISARIHSQVHMRNAYHGRDDYHVALLSSNMAINHQMLNATMPATSSEDLLPPYVEPPEIQHARHETQDPSALVTGDNDLSASANGSTPSSGNGTAHHD